MKVWLVYIHADDGNDYESMHWDDLLNSFDSEEKVIKYCETYSDKKEEENYFVITSPKELPRDDGSIYSLNDDPFYEYILEYGECWLDYTSVNVN